MTLPPPLPRRSSPVSMLASGESIAQSDYPNSPIKLIVGFAPGGSTDIVGRIVAQRLGERLGQTVVVENKAGAGGTIGADADRQVARPTATRSRSARPARTRSRRARTRSCPTTR